MSNVDIYVTCPYNKSHRIIKARFQTHLYKCRRNYPNTKLTCPFDATHMLDPQEYEHHLTVCTTSGNVKCYQNILEPKHQVGTVSLEVACNIQTSVLKEDWSGNHPTYNPCSVLKNKSVIVTPMCMTKSEKKLHKRSERDRIAALENNNCSSNISSNASIIEKSLNFEQPLRAPKKAAKAISCNNSNITDDLIFKLKDISIETKNDTFSKEDVSIVNNNSCKNVDYQEHNLTNSTIDGSNNSLILNNIIKQEEKRNVSAKEMYNAAMDKNSAKVKEENISEVKNNFETNPCTSQGNNSKARQNCKETDIKKYDRTNLNEGSYYEFRNDVRLNPNMTAKCYGEAKKISTGRGFTIAYQYLNTSMMKTEGNESRKNLSSAYGYDED